jgi:hypothetical protein
MAKQNKKEKKIEQEAKEQLVQPTIPIYPDPVPTIQFAPYPNHFKIENIMELSSYTSSMNELISLANWFVKKNRKLLLDKQKIEQAKKLMDYFG